MDYQKLIILQELNNSLKDFQNIDDYLEIENLIEKNLSLFLDEEKKEENYRSNQNDYFFKEALEECYSEDKEKAFLVSSRWVVGSNPIGSGSRFLEMTFYSPKTKEYFIKIDDEDGIYSTRQIEREQAVSLAKARDLLQERVRGDFAISPLCPPTSKKEVEGVKSFFDSLRV